MSSPTPSPEPWSSGGARGTAGTWDLPDGLVGTFSANWPRLDEPMEIRGGGAVAVDTVTLRAAADRFAAAEADLDGIGRRLASLQHALKGVPEHTADARAAASALRAKLDQALADAAGIATALREAAFAYEIVELEAEHRAAVLAGDTARAEELDTRVSRLVAEHPDAWRTALWAEFERGVMWPSELVRQATQWGVEAGGYASEPGALIGGVGAGLLTLGGAALAGTSGAGRLSRDARLAGAAGPITLTPVAPAAPGTGMPTTPAVSGAPAGASRAASTIAPQSLAAVTQRMPGAGASQVRVERYAMPDGTHQYAVYIAGTQSMAVGGDDPWDNESNVELYSGRMSDSYAATVAALEAAGAQPGDVVHAFGHSQGGMIATHLSLEGGYDVQTLVTLGSPVAADVGPDTLSVALRHTDDPIAGLAGGGYADAVGAPGSFVAERVSDPDADLDDIAMPAHRVTAYTETAALVDASTDPRVDGLRDVFDELATAEAVEVTEYVATRG